MRLPLRCMFALPMLCLTAAAPAVALSPDVAVDQLPQDSITRDRLPAPEPSRTQTIGDIIMAQVAQCWTPPSEAAQEPLPAPVVRLSLDENGGVTSMALDKKSQALFQSNAAFREIALSAILAIKECTPIQGLPTEKYAQWKELQLQFDTSAIMPKTQSPPLQLPENAPSEYQPQPTP